ncbi:DUF3310 domain-containing protein [Streptomyces globisporus]|uniref:DUF3310 domain-containing protein n=1 Tax=Streptomyces globisporus TaxID=1908 RepID=UPI0036D07620
MRNYEVGDRVVVVSDEIGRGYWTCRRGKVSEITSGVMLPNRVEFDGGGSAAFRSDELELESVYDALSAPSEEEKSSDGDLFYEAKVASCDDAVNHPSHYTSHPSGVECIQVTEHMNFNLGNSVKYLWRAGLKGEDTSIQDLQKAVWYIEREIQRLGGSVG